MSNSAKLVSACLFMALFHGSQFAFPQTTQQPTELQDSGLAEARVTVLNGKTAVLLRTGVIIKRKHADPEEQTGSVYLGSSEDERALVFPAEFFCRQVLLYGQVGVCTIGQITVTDSNVRYLTSKENTGFLCPRTATTIKSEGGREGDTFSLYDQKGTRYRFGIAKFNSPLVTFLRAAIAAFPSAYSQAQLLTATPANSTEVAATVESASQQPQVTTAVGANQLRQQQNFERQSKEEAAQQQQATAAEEESKREQRIQQLKADIQQQEASAESWDRSAQDMENSNNNNCTTGGLGGLFCRGIGTVGIAKAKKEAAKARNQAAADQEEIERLQGLEVQNRRLEDESFGGQFQQAAAQNDLSTQRIKGSAATAAGPGTSNPQEGSMQQDGSAQPTYRADRHYEGLDSNWVKTLLRNNGDWSCPTSLSQTNTATGFASQANNVCMRDSYVWAAVLEAWGAECESRFSRDQVAAQDAASMKGNLISAAKLCSNVPVFGPGPECGSAKIVDCKDLAALKNQ
jgi:hypothetical protein